MFADTFQDAFYEQFNEAKACVEEPPQPKIKLRAPSTQTASSAPGKPKRITIHVGGGREDSQGSPAPQAGASTTSTEVPPAAPAITNGSMTKATTANAAPATSNPTPSTIPTPATATMKREDSTRQSSAIPPQISNGYSASAFRPVIPPVNGLGQHQQPGLPNGHAPIPQYPQRPLYELKYRGPGTGMLTITPHLLALIITD